MLRSGVRRGVTTIVIPPALLIAESPRKPSSKPPVCKFGVSQHPLALCGDCGDRQTDERIVGDLLALNQPS
jgi:hypothetical protein